MNVKKTCIKAPCVKKIPKCIWRVSYTREYPFSNPSKRGDTLLLLCLLLTNESNLERCVGVKSAFTPNVKSSLIK